MIRLFYRLLATLTCALALSAAAQEVASQAPSDLPVSLFAQLPRMQQAVLSPDGRNIAYLYPFEGRQHIVLQPLGDAENRKIVPPAGELEFSWINWGNNDRLVFAATFFGERFGTDTTETRLASIAKDGSDLQWIIRAAGVEEAVSATAANEDDQLMEQTSDAPPQVQDDVINWLPDEPDHILVALDEDFDGMDEVRRVDINTGEYTVIRGGVPGVQRWMTDSSHQVRMGYGYLEDRFTLKYLESTLEWTDLTTSDWWAQGWQPVAFAKQLPQAYAIGPGASGRDVVRKIDLITGEVIEDVFEAGTYDVEGVILDRRTRQPIGVSFVDHFPRDKYFEPQYDRLQRTAEKAFSGRNVRLKSLSSDRQQVLVEVSTDTDPGVLYFWDRTAKSMDVVTEYMPGLLPELLSSVDEQTYSARDGYELSGYLTLPRDQEENDLPTVVLPHGGPAERSDKSFSFIAQFLASRGYAVFSPNFRGSTGLGAEHFSAGRGQWGRLMQQDVVDAATWLVESGIAAKDRLCIVGHSYGGYVAAMAAAEASDQFRCAAAVNAPLNLQALANDSSKSIVIEAWVDDVGAKGAELEAVSPHQQAARMNIPLLVVQAADDVRVPPDQAEQFEQAVLKADGVIERVVLTDGGHALATAQSREATLAALERFLEQHTKSR